MTMTDPIADMLTRLRISEAAKHETGYAVPKFKANIAEILKREGWASRLHRQGSQGRPDFLRSPSSTVRTVSVPFRALASPKPPGLRRYAKSDSLPMPLGGLGIAIISTSSGLLTQKECLDRGIGGEIVAFVW